MSNNRNRGSNRSRNKRIRRERHKGYVLICLIAVAALLCGAVVLKMRDIPGQAKTEVKANKNVVLLGNQIHSPTAVLIKAEGKDVMMQKEMNRRIYPASLTKIMTILTAIEMGGDGNKEVVLPKQMFQRLQKENASMAGFLPGEKVKVKDLLAGALLPSGAEACEGLAVNFAGSEKKFVDKMNEKAEELGMAGTHFTNVTGLQDTNHYTTVRDIAVLLSHAIKNDAFREYFTARTYTTDATNMHGEGVTFQSTMFSSMSSNKLNKGEIEGGKTGFTDEAGLCLASLAVIGGEEYILVTAGAPGNHLTEPLHIEDAFTVYNMVP